MKRRAYPRIGRPSHADAAALRRAEQAFRTLYEYMRDAFVSVDMQGRIRQYNRSFQELVGYTDAELAQLTYQDLTPARWHAIEERIVQEQILPRGYSEVYEKEYRRKDGTLVPIELCTGLTRDAQGRPIEMWAIIRDITARRQIEARLQHLQAVTACFAAAQTRAEVRLVIRDDLVQALGAMIVGLRLIVARELLLEDLTQSEGVPAEMLRYFSAIPLTAHHPAAATARSGVACFHRDVAAVVQDYPELAEAARAISLQASAHLPLRRGAEVFGVLSLLFAEPRAWDEGERGFALALADRAAQALARTQLFASLQESEVRFRTLTDAVPQVIWTNDTAGMVQYFNQRWYDYSGLSLEESLGFGWQAIIHPDDVAALVERWHQALAAGTIFDTEYRLRRADGAYRWHLGRTVPLRGEDGEIVGWFGSATDIEDLKIAEAARQESAMLRRLADAQEEERLRIARDLHDQLGQQITGLILGLKQLEGHVAHAPAAATLVSLQTLALDLARESHRIAMNLRPTALEDIGLVPALERLVADWSRQVGVPAAFASSGLAQGRLPRPVEVALFRVAQEALTNVQKHAAATNVGVIIERRGDLVIAVVEDNGCGFAAEEPPANDGRPQLGLLGMRERVAQVGGTLEIESAPGSGTSVFVRVPL